MKKILLLIIILLLTSCSKETMVFNEQEIFCNVVITKDNKNIINEFKNGKYFICNNLETYLNYYIINNVSISNVISEVNVGLVNDYYTNVRESDVSKNNLILVNKYNYLNKEYVPNDLEEISSTCNMGYSNKLRSIARSSFEKMCLKAREEGINLYSVSAYRSYYNQEKIYNNNLKVNSSNTDTYLAKAGYSEHQSGLAVDINKIDSSFSYTIEYYWLKNNAHDFGFIERYPLNKERITGYKYEPWHFRYVGEEVASIIKEEDITFDEYYAYYLS